MKARVKKTGDIINVIPEQGGWCDTDFKSYSQHYEDKELDFEFQDWESFRREAAKDVMCQLIGMCRDDGYKYSPEQVASYAIVYADELIKQLKEEQ